MKVQQELFDFDKYLTQWTVTSGIGRSYLQNPESLVLEAADKQYVKLQKAFALRSLFMAVRQEGWRFRTIVRRTGAYLMPHFGDIHWIEINEPDPDDGAKQIKKPNLQAVSFYVDDIGAAHTAMEARGLEPQSQEDGFSVSLPGREQKLLFTDVGLDYAVEQFVQNESAIQVQLAARQ